MKKWVLPTTRNAAYRMVAIPAVINLVFSFFLISRGVLVSYSTLLGGLAWVIPNLYFAYKVFSNMRPDASNAIMKNFYLAEFNKLALTALLVVLIVKYVKIDVLFFFIGYMVVQISFWLTPFFSNRAKKT